ncbi:gliding motility-associated C-terminal domain-containing protein, partial [Chryseolinea sp. H1M3-3]|uniref:T9SS type B sorting domain-containing protein n=1 Tax=Chryseolinea sp. H1M3-3 TaxID=3034144 RepID=UPI0023EC42E5
ANPSVCVGSTSANLSYSATAASPDQYSINFNAAAEAQGFVDVVNAALPATPIVITVPGAAVAGTYNATLSVRNSVTGCISTNNNISVTVVANPTITLGANPSICIGSATANLPYSATTGSPNQYSIDFNAAAEGQGFVDVSNVALPASPVVITVPGAAVAGTYNGTLTVRNTVTGCTSISQPISVTINPTPTITLGANPSVCTGATAASLPFSATTGTPNQYSINFNAAAEAQGFVDVVNAALPATPISITVPGAAAAGTYNATITVRNSTTGCVSASQPISVTVVASPTITLGANPSVCVGSTSANLSYSATAASPDQYSINFNAAAEAQGFVDVVNAALPATPIVITVPGAAVAGTYNATLSVFNSVTGCSSPAQNISVTLVANPSITLGANPAVCIGATSANLTYSATTGSPNQYSIDFNAAAEAQGFVDVTNLALPASPIGITIPGGAVAGTYTATLTVLNTVTGCISTNQAISVTIDATPTITLGANPSVCLGSPTANLPYTATTGTPDQYSIDFNAAAEAQGFVDVVNAALPATPISITIPGAAVVGVYNATITVRNSAVSCSSATQPITVTIDDVPSIAGIVVGSVCAGSTSTNLNYTTLIGSPDQYSIDFDPTAEAQGFVDVVNTALPASPIAITIPALAGAGNYNAIVTVTNSSTGCPGTGVPITVTILANPTITLGPSPEVCAGTTTADLTYTATTGSPNQYSINFNAAAEAQGFVDVVLSALPASPISITVPGAAATGTYSGTLTVLSTSSTCSSTSQPISVTINPSPTITLGPNPTVCSGLTTVDLGYTATTGSPTQYAIDFDPIAEAQGFVDIANTALPASPIALTVPASAAAAIYNATITVINTTTGCASSTQAFTIRVIQSPSAAISGNATICNGASTNITITFVGDSPWAFRYSDGTTTSPLIPSFFSTISFPVSPSATTTYTLVTVSNLSGCPGTVSGSAVVTVNQNPQTNLPVAVTLDPLCSGGSSDITVSNSEVGVSYQLRNDADDSPVGTAVVGNGATILLPTGPLVATTTFNVLATATGCASVELNNVATVNVSGVINPSLAVTALANPICEGNATIIQVTNSENGVLYQLRDDSNNNAIGASVAGNGSTIDLPTGNLTATTVFNVLATNGSCSIELTDIETVNVNVNPDASLAVAVSLDPICVGGSSDVTVALSETGVSYQLRNDADDSNVGVAVLGNGGTINLPTGVLNATTVFNILATSGICPAVELTALATVNVSGTIDASLGVTAAASPICSGTGTNIQIANSENGISYQLRNNADNSPIGLPVVGTGGNIDLPTGNLSATTTFNILAGNGTCSIQLTDTETVAVDVAPSASLAVGTTLDPLCGGGISAITVALSEVGVTYQLRNDADDSNVGVAVAGTGGTINLSTGVLNATTTFNVLASSGVCTAVELTQLATVTVAGSVNAALNVTESGSPICEGTATFIQVELSEVGVNYQLRNDATDTNIGTAIAGTGGTINLPTGNLTATTTFNVVASNGTCSIELTDTETITVSPAPDLTLAVAPASGLICPGAATNIIVTASELGVSYQLRNNADNSSVGGAVAGTGGNINLPTGNLSASITFNVFATVGTCSGQLIATASVAVRPVGDPACGPGGSDCANFSAIIPTIVTQPSCNDRDAGEVSFNIARANGTPTTFRVIWSYNGTDQTKFTASTVSFDDLSSGNYQYTIIDEGNGKTCGPVDFFLDLKTQVEIQAKQVLANVTCFEGTDGNVKLTVDGSTTGEYWYKYVLDGQESIAQTFTPGAPLPGGLPADDNDFIIIKVDQSPAFACPDTVMVRIKHTYGKIDFAVASTEVTTCNGTDGAIQVTGITGGNTTTTGLQIRLKKEVPLSTDPSGYIVVADYETVTAGAKEYTDLSQGNYIIDIQDESDCRQSKPIAIQAPGQVPLAVIDMVATDASCANEGASGTIQVTINQPGIYQVAVSQDQVNVPADDQFVAYNSPSLPNITFNNLIRGRYFLYIKSSTTQCPTRTDVISIGGVFAVSDFDVISNCENVNLTLNNITGQESTPFVIRVFNNNDKFFKIDSLTASEIPLSNAVSFVYSAPLQHKFLTEQGTYRFVMIQNQTTGSGTCTLVSDTVVYDVREQIGIVLGNVVPSFPDPKRTGSIEVENIIGGTRFVSGTNELYYEISLTTADDDIVVFDWAPAKLSPQNKFYAKFDYLSPGVYRVKVRDAGGCIKTQDIEISLDPSVYVPNIFTPNEDAVNDEFEVLNLPLQGKHELIISNRWGNEVFKSKDYRVGNFWKADGASDGIYFYRLQVEGGETYTGWVEVLRGNKP